MKDRGDCLPWETLKEKREQKGLTIEEVADRLKVSKKYLLLLEKGELSGLPEPVFVKGYIRAYCKLLEIDSEPFLEEFNEFLEERSAEFRPRIENLPDIPRRTWLTKRIVVSSIVLLLIFVALGIVVSQVKKEKRLLKMRTNIEEELARETALARREKKVESKFVRKSFAGGEAREKVAEGEKKKDARLETRKASKIEEAAIARKKKLGRLNLVIEAKELTWIFVSPDGRDPRDVTLYPGDRIEVRAEKEIYLKVGNASGVVVRLNGRDVDMDGTAGEVVEKKFTIGDLR